MFEIVKHVFDVEGVKFIYAVNVDALKKSILHVYGDVDADLYLQKFIDISVALPSEVKMESNVNSSRIYLYFNDKLCTVTDDAALKDTLFPEADSHFQHGWQCYEAVENLINRWHLSMRDVEKLIRYLKIPYSFDRYFGVQTVPIVFLSFVFSVLRKDDTEQFLNKTNQDLYSFLFRYLGDCGDDAPVLHSYLDLIKNDLSSGTIESDNKIFSEVARSILRIKC